jgi:diacylglycerol kinase (ATP)
VTGTQRGAARGGLGRAAAGAARGVARSFAEEPNLRIQAVVALAALALSLWLGTGTAVVLLCCALVIGSELLNTALERLADALHPDPHPLVGAAKDAAAGAVLVCAVTAVLVGLVSMGPALLERVRGWLT